MRNLVIGAIFLSLAASIWGAMYVVVKVVVEVVPPLELVWMRYLIAVIALGIIGIMMRQSWKIAKKRLADPFSCWPYWEHDFHCDTGNGHNAIHRADGGNYYGDNPCFYGCLRPFDFKRKHYAEKVLVYRSCHDWRGDHCRQRKNRRDTAIRRTLFTTCCLNVGIDVGIRQKGTKPLLTNCCHNLYIYDCRDVIDPFCPSKAKEFRYGECFTADYFGGLALLRHYLNSWWFFIVE